jgi:hypothetical protein
MIQRRSATSRDMFLRSASSRIESTNGLEHYAHVSDAALLRSVRPAAASAARFRHLHMLILAPIVGVSTVRVKPSKMPHAVVMQSLVSPPMCIPSCFSVFPSALQPTVSLYTPSSIPLSSPFTGLYTIPSIGSGACRHPG